MRYHQHAEILNYPQKNNITYTQALRPRRFMPYVIATRGEWMHDAAQQKGENRIKDKTLINFMLRKDMAFNMLHHALYLWLAEIPCGIKRITREWTEIENRKRKLLENHRTECEANSPSLLQPFVSVNVKSINEKFKRRKSKKKKRNNHKDEMLAQLSMTLGEGMRIFWVYSFEGKASLIGRRAIEIGEFICGWIQSWIKLTTYNKY